MLLPGECVVAGRHWHPRVMRRSYLRLALQASTTRALALACGTAPLPLAFAGGIREQLWVCKPGEDVTVIGDRKGFVKLALETGSPLVPVYIFNERKAFVINR